MFEYGVAVIQVGYRSAIVRIQVSVKYAMAHLGTRPMIINIVSMRRGSVTLEKRIGDDGVTIIQVGDRSTIIPGSIVHENTAVDDWTGVDIPHGAAPISDDTSLES